MAQAEDANYGDIKTEALGSLTIHKHLNGGGEPIGLPERQSCGRRPAPWETAPPS